MAQGFPWHDADASVKQALSVRRMKLPATGAVFPLRPSCVMPSMMARPEAVDTARSLRPWGGPCDALASVCGREALCWERAWLACGRPSLRGTTVQDPHTGPRDVVADAPLTRGATPQVSVPTPVGGGGVLGGSVVEAAETGTRGAGRGRVCHGRHGARARLPGTRGV